MKMKNESNKLRTGVLAGLAACSMVWLGSMSVNGATVTWDNGFHNQDWTRPTNWDTDALPTNADTVEIGMGVGIYSGATGEADVVNFRPSGSGNNLSILSNATLNANAVNLINEINPSFASEIKLNIQNSAVNVAGDLTLTSSSIDTNQKVTITTTGSSTDNDTLDIDGNLILNAASTLIESNSLRLEASNITGGTIARESRFILTDNAAILLDNNADANINTSLIFFEKSTELISFDVSGTAIMQFGSLSIDGDGVADNEFELHLTNTAANGFEAIHGIDIKSKRLDIVLDQGYVVAGNDGIVLGRSTNNKSEATTIDAFSLANNSTISTSGDFECYASGTLDLGNGTIQAANINKYRYEGGTSYDPGQWLTINMAGGNLIALGTVTDGSDSDAVIQFNKEMSSDRYDQLVGYGTVTAGYTDGGGVFHKGEIRIGNYAGIVNDVNGETLTFNGNMQVVGIENIDADPANNYYHPYSLKATNGGNIVVNGDVGYQGVYVADVGSSITINGDLSCETTTINGNVIVNGDILTDVWSDVTVKNTFGLQDGHELLMEVFRPDDQFLTDNGIGADELSGTITVVDGGVMNLDGDLRVKDVTANFTSDAFEYGQYVVGDEFELIKTEGTGSLEGEFDNVYLPTETNGVMLKIDLNTADDDGVADYMKLLAQAAGISPTVNAKSEGMKKTMGAIDKAAANNAAFNIVVTDILNLPTQQKQQAAVESLQQNNLLSQSSTATNLATSNANAMHSRFNGVQQGQVFAWEPSSNQSNRVLAGGEREMSDYMLMLSDDSEELTGSPVFDWFNGHGGGLFLTSGFTHTDHNSTENQVGFESYQSDFLIGGDFMAAENLRVGGAIGYAYVTTDNLNSLGGSETNALNTQLYANYYAAPNLRIDLTAGYTYAAYELERNLFNGETAFGNTHNHQFTAEAGVNYLMEDTGVEGLVLTPFAYMRYVNSNINGYTETEAGHLGLKVDDQSNDSLTSSIGAVVSMKYELSNSVLEPFVSASYEHQFIDQDRSTDVSFIGDPANPFKAFVDGTDTDYVNLSVGSLWALSDKLMLRATFDTVLFHDELESQRVSAGFRFNF
ncbi:autotransporter outer membrane beta-barrel domain-containing protein [Planctomycetota bacterium]|nr:autotransporter outer membrane beta-barrel domain-containing protein [Planctomycetota bacterium]